MRKAPRPFLSRVAAVSAALLLGFAAPVLSAQVPAVAADRVFRFTGHEVQVDEAIRVRQGGSLLMTIRWFAGNARDVQLSRVSPTQIGGTISVAQEDFVITTTRVDDQTLRVTIGRSRGAPGGVVQAVLYIPEARVVGGTVVHARGNYVLPEAPGRKEYPKSLSMTLRPVAGVAPFTVRMRSGNFMDLRDYRAEQQRNRTFQIFVVGRPDSEVEFDLVMGVE